MTKKPGTAAKTAPLLLPKEKMTILFLVTMITIALLLPYPLTKQILIVVFGFFMTRLFFSDLPLALCLLPLLVPAKNLVRPDLIPIPGINYETLLMGLTLVAWGMQRGSFEPKRPAKPMPAFVAIFLAFLAWITLAALNTAVQGTITPWVLFSAFKNEWVYSIVLFVVADSLRDERDRIRMMVAVCIGVILLSIQPILNGTETMARGMSLASHRAISLLGNQPNIYGGALACFAPFPLIYFAKRVGGKKGRTLFGLAIGVAAYALVLTLSRGSWLAFGAAVTVIGVFFERRVLYILAVGALLAPLWIPEEAVNRGDTISEIDVSDENLDEEEGSAFVRIDQWRMIPAVLADAPILGHGYGSFPDLYERFGSLGRRKAAHVGYAEYAGELGIPGAALYVAIFLALGGFALVLSRRGTTLFSKLHGIGLLGTTTAILVAECFGSRFKVGVVTCFLWIYAGVGIAAWRWPAKESAEETAATALAEDRELVRRGVRARRVPTRP